MRWRLWHRLYAGLFGYFWLPCPRCGREFGGHEWRDGDSIPTGRGARRAICPACGRRARGEEG